MPDSNRSGIYQHYKGGLYRVIGVAEHTENKGELVVYVSLKDKKMYVRPKSMFFGKVKANGRDIPRFVFLRQPHLEQMVED